MTGSELLKKTRVAVIGAGTIGGAVAETLARTGIQVWATRRNLDRIRHFEEQGITITKDNVEAARQADVVMFVVKPHKLIPLAREVAEELRGKPVLSFAAAIDLELMCRAVPDAHWIRAMSNTAIRVRQAFTMYAPSPQVEESELDLLEELFALMGTSERVDEANLDALTAMAGSGPAYIYTMLEALIFGGLRVGLPRDLTLRAAAYTAIGASELLLSTGKHPAVLRDQVLTPGGVTIDGIYELEDGQIRTAFMNAVKAASEKAQVISRDIRKQTRQELEAQEK